MSSLDHVPGGLGIAPSLPIANASGPSEQILDLLPVAVYVCDRDGAILRCNRRAVELWGRSPKLGQTTERFCGSYRLYRLDGGPLPHAQCPMADVLRTGEPVRDQEVVIERPDGSRVVAITNIDAIWDGAGTIVGAVNCLSDVTAQRQKEEARRGRQEWSEQLIQALPAAIYTTDAAGGITSFNEAAATLWGCRPEIGKSEFCGSWKLYWPDGTPLPHDECPMAMALKQKRPIRGMEAIAERPDGTRIPFIPYPTPIFDPSGELIGAINMLVDITDRKRAEAAVRTSEERYRGLFENVRVAVFEEDFSRVLAFLDNLRAAGVTELRSYFRERPAQLEEAVRLVRLVDVNDYALELFEVDEKASLLTSLAGIFAPETTAAFLDELVALWNGRRYLESETRLRTLKGRNIDAAFTIAFNGEQCERALVSILDISAQKAAEREWQEQAYYLDNMNRVAKLVSSNTDVEGVVQLVTDTATRLCGAKFGAFFYNVADEQGDRYMLYSLSGAAREAFSKFPLPRNTAVFESTFRGLGVVRSDDIRTDPRYGKSAPHFGMPKGHLPVVSYLAVPVLSRSGEVHGGLFFGHDQPGVFSEKAHNLAAGIAVHAGIALDNAHLLRSVRSESERRRQAEQAARQLASVVESSDDAIMTKDFNGIITSWNMGAQRLFGYSADELVGQPGAILIPEDRQDEEPEILDRIRRGEHVDHYDTVRRRKDGTSVDVSLSVSPVKDDEGRTVAASKIARDISERKRAQSQQELLLAEMSHRVKNLFAVASGLVTLSARSARTPQDMAKAIQERLWALTRAHELTRPGLTEAVAQPDCRTSLDALARMILSPYLEQDGESEGERIRFAGPELTVADAAVTSVCLILHELATNAAKYGGLSVATGRVRITWSIEAGEVVLTWAEHGGPTIEGEPNREGFGSALTHRLVSGQFRGRLSRQWNPEGLIAQVVLPLEHLTAP